MSTRPTPSQLGDGWFASEEPIGTGVIHELRRVRRRFVARPLPVLLLAGLLTAAVMGIAALALLPVVWATSRLKPPLGFVVFAALVAAAPVIVVAVRLMTR